MQLARSDRNGVGVSEIARRLERHRATIHWEIARNRCVDGYRPDSAARRAWARRLRGWKIERSIRLRNDAPAGRRAGLHRYFQEWFESGVSQAFWRKGLPAYDAFASIDWSWLCWMAPWARRRWAGKKLA